MDNDLLPFAEATSLSCSDMELLLDYYVEGELPEPILSTFSEHIKACPQCETLVRDVTKIVGVAKTLDHRILPFAVGERLRAKLKEEFGAEIAPSPKLLVVK